MHIVCSCGNHLSDIDAPNDVKLYLYTNSEWNKIKKMGTCETIYIPLPEEYNVWKCNKCNGLMFLQWGTAKLLKIYKYETCEKSMKTCKCGKVFDDLTLFNDSTFWVYTDNEWISMIEKDFVDASNMPLPKHIVQKCECCARGLVFERATNKLLYSYIPDENYI